jgi:hypothetical protein
MSVLIGFVHGTPDYVSKETYQEHTTMGT